MAYKHSLKASKEAYKFDKDEEFCYTSQLRSWSMTPHTPGFFFVMAKTFLNALKFLKKASFIALILLVTPWGETVSHQPLATDAKTVPTQEMRIEAKALDQRAIILRDYLTRYNSPLADYAQDFVDAADAYGVDWKLVPSIAGVESTFGRVTPGNDYYPSYNGWGWGVYGTQAIYFKSWKDGIYTVTAGMKQNYISKGITSPYQMNYTYASSPYWGGHVAYFMGDLDRFAKNYEDGSLASQQDPTIQSNAASQSDGLNTVSSNLSSDHLTFAFQP